MLILQVLYVSFISSNIEIHHSSSVVVEILSKMDSTSLRHIKFINETKLYIKRLNEKKRFRRYQIKSEIENIKVSIDKLIVTKSWFSILPILTRNNKTKHLEAVCVRLIRYLERKVLKFTEADEKCSEEDNCASDSYDESFINTSDYDSDSN